MTASKHIGKYEIREELGRGGFAVVYKARDPSLDRMVALKVLHAHVADNAAFVQRFRQEARTAARFNHPHIVTIYEVGEEAGQYYIAMQYLSGKSLDALLAEIDGPLPLEQVAAIIVQIADALDYIHQRDAVHRDVKPSNVIVSEAQYATLLDFGIVRAADGTQLTATGGLMGTPRYMSPEQAEGQSIDHHSDIYALGVVAYQLCTGKAPFDNVSPLVVLRAHADKVPPAPRELNPDLPESVETVLLKALAKRPDERYQSAGELARALRAALAAVEAARFYERMRDAVADADWREVLALIKQLETLGAGDDQNVQDLKEEARRKLRRQQLVLAWAWSVGGVVLLGVVMVLTRTAFGGWVMMPWTPELVTTSITPSATLTETPAPSATPTNTPTKTPTPTPTPMIAIGRIAYPYVYEAPTGQVLVGTLTRGAQVYLCAKAGDRYLIALDQCHLGKPYGWVPEAHIDLKISQETFPSDLITPIAFPPANASLYTTWTRPVDGMIMVYVPEGSFRMGSEDGADNEQPVHEVTLNAFWIDRTEITHTQYARCVAEGACEESSYADNADSDGNSYPVVGVSWYDAKAYCEWADARLPTEAEWEYAARGPEGHIYPWGNEEPACELTQYSGCSGDTVSVGSFPAGASWCDALDMAGNVWEWVADWYDGGYYQQSPLEDPTGPETETSIKVLRGGAWYSNPEVLRCAFRGRSIPDNTWDSNGFRCARDSR